MKRSKLTLTHTVVGVTIGLPLVALAFLTLPKIWALAASFYLFYEGWTIVNKTKRDTITEVVREYARKTEFVPWFFGFGTAYLLESKNLVNPYAIGALLYLQGHLFFYRVRK